MAQPSTTSSESPSRKKVVHLRERVKKAGKNTKEKALQKYQKGKLKVQKMEADVQNKIRQKPLTSVIAAAGTGLVLGSLVSLANKIIGKRRSKQK